MKKKILLVVTSLVVTLAFAEVVLRIMFPIPPVWREPQHAHLESPLLGWVLPPNGGGYTIDAPVSINSIGLRDDEFDEAKPPGEFRILCLGDSFTFALGVKFEDLYTQILERRLEKSFPNLRFQVINAGVGGYNTRQELIYLLARGLSLHPDIVVVGFFWNDILYNEKPLPDIDTTPLLTEEPKEIQWGLPKHLIPSWLRNTLRKSLVLYLTTQAAKKLQKKRNPPENLATRLFEAHLSGDEGLLDPYWELTGKRLREIAAVGKENDIPVVLMVFPMEPEIKDGSLELSISRRLSEIWRPTGLPIVDLKAEYRKSLQKGQNPFLPYDRHPNRKGMELAAQALYVTIVGNGLLESHIRPDKP